MPTIKRRTFVSAVLLVLTAALPPGWRLLGLAPRVFRCLASPLTVLDHRPTGMLLHPLPISPVVRGHGMRRTRMDFRANDWLQRDWLAWLRDKARDAPDNFHALLLAWWSGFKRDLLCSTRSLNQVSRPQPEFQRRSWLPSLP